MDPGRKPASAPIARYGRYEALFRIAAGGMAEVYAARLVGEGGFEKIVALKRMLPTLAEDERFVAMFLDEGRVAANISSPHVVQTLDLGRADDDSLYLVMELVVGVSLSALLRKLGRDGQQLPVRVAVEILAQAAQGLHDAHEARTLHGEPLGIVHRDVSPQNVLVDVGGRARITDFGVARALQRITHTQSGEVKGKLAYFAPEQASGKELDRRADVFALGIIAWEALAMQRLFAGDNPADTLMRLLTKPIPRLDEVRPEVPAAVADAVARALERDLGARAPSAAAFADQLRASGAAASVSEVASFVGANGGEALLRLQDGLRSISPSSPGAKLVRGSQRLSGLSGGALSPALSESDEAPTWVTPSSSLRLHEVASQVRTLGASGALGAASSAASTPAFTSPSSAGMAEAAPRRSTVSPRVVGAIVIGGALLALLALLAAVVLGRRGDGAPAVSATPPSAATPPPAPPERVAPDPPPPAPSAGVEASAAVVPEEVDDTDEPAPAEPPARGGRRRRGASAPAAPRARVVAEPASARPAASEAAPRPDRARSGAGEPGAGTPPPERSRPGALRGLDDFERELSR